MIIIHSSGQVNVKNGSFEGEPGMDKNPSGWQSYGKDSSPDILPGPWSVYTPAYDGTTYCGLITRENGTWEMIGQVLSEPMRKNECYEFNIALARSMTYEGYNQPVKFRLWGGFSLGDKKNLLIESQQAISHSDWKLYNYFFFAQDNYTYILIEPYYANAQGLPYRGNLLLDGLTTFKRCLRADEQNDSDNH